MPSDFKPNQSVTFCFICEESVGEQFELKENEYVSQKCSRCGEFKITGDAVPRARLPADLQINLSGWIHDQNRDGMVPLITPSVLEVLEHRQIPSFIERAERLLLEMVSGKNQYGAHIKWTNNYIGATYSRNEQDMSLLTALLVHKGWITHGVTHLNAFLGYRVLPEGYFAYDKLTRKLAKSDKAFVAMSFQKELDSVYAKSIGPAIEAVGYNAIRIDQTEHINKIDDEIIVKINESKFIVVDCTNQRQSVYFEAGYAMGIGIPIIWTCQKDGIDDLHFDVRQYNCIPWEKEDLEDFKKKLQNRIEATVGKRDSLQPLHKYAQKSKST